MISKDKRIGAWWIGTIQSVADATKLLPGQSPTTLVVACGVLGAMIYAFMHPDLGVIHPDQMDPHESMKWILPYLQPFVSFGVKGWKPFVQAKFDAKQHKNVTEKPQGDWTFDKFLL